MTSAVVLKVGGSLFSLPDLGDRLRALLKELGPAEVVMVPGGGSFADVVRDLDAVHRWPPEVSHQLAIHSMSLSAAFLSTLDPDWILAGSSLEIESCRSKGQVAVVDVAKSRWIAGLPASWDVTSDSIAAVIARVYGRLVLGKSADLPRRMVEEEDLSNEDKSHSRREILIQLSRAGLVDREFPAVAASVEQIGWVNLRGDCKVHWLPGSATSSPQTARPTC